MSNLVVSNISDGTTTVGTGYVVNGSAKAWVNFNGTGTIAARDSLNLSSLTDNATGDYTVNFTNAMGNANYSFGGMIGGSVGAPRDIVSKGAAPPTASNFTVFTLNSSEVRFDCEIICASAHGDLA